MSNEIKTTMTLEQQQMLREFQRQNVALLKNADAFLQVAKAGKKTGDDIAAGMKTGFDSVQRLAAGLTGVTSMLSVAQKTVALIGAEYDKINRQAKESALAIRTPAEAMRQAAMNVGTGELDWLDKVVKRIATHPDINAQREIVAGVASGVRSATGIADLGIVEKSVETALRTIGPRNGQAAEQVGIGLMNVLTTEQRFDPNLKDPRGAVAALQMLGTESHPKDMEKTIKSFGGLHSAWAHFGQRFRESAAMYAAVTNETKDQTGEVTAAGLRETGASLMEFQAETNDARRQRITTEFDDALAHTDFIGNQDAKFREKLKDRLAVKNLMAPEEHGRAAIELLEESRLKVRSGSDDDKLLAAKIERIRKATTAQQSTDVAGNKIDIPMEQVTQFQAAKTPFEKLQALRTMPELGAAISAHANFGRGKIEEFMKALIRNDAKSWRQVEEPLTRLKNPTNELAADFEKWLAKVNALQGQSLAKAQNALESNIQSSKINRTTRARRDIAKTTLEETFKQLSTSVAEDWWKTQVIPFLEMPEMKTNPEDVAIRQIQKGLGQSERELLIGKPKDMAGRAALFLDRLQSDDPSKRPMPHPSSFEPFTGAEREDYEEDIRLQKKAIELLRKLKAEATAPAPPPMPAGQEVGLITRPIKQRLRPDIDFMTADTGDTVARQMALAQRSPESAIIDRATQAAEENNVGIGREAFVKKSPEEISRFFRGLARDRSQMARTGQEEVLFGGDERGRLRKESESAQSEIDSGFRYDWSWNRPALIKAAEQKRDRAQQGLAGLETMPGGDSSADRLLKAAIDIEEAPFRVKPKPSTDEEMAKYVTPSFGPYSDFVKTNQHWKNEPTGFEQSPTVSTAQAAPEEPIGSLINWHSNDEQELPAAERQSGDVSDLRGLSKEERNARAAEISARLGIPAADVGLATSATYEGWIDQRVQANKINPQPVVMSERAQAAWAAVAAKKEGGPAAIIKKEPTPPVMSERAQAAWAAVEDSHGINVPQRSERSQKAWEAVQSSHEAPKSFAEAESRPQPNITVQGGDTKPVVSSIQETNAILKEVASLLKRDRESSSNRQASRGVRERNTTRPAAALSKG